MTRNSFIWLVVFFGLLFYTGFYPVDRFTWFLEVAPALMALLALGVTRRRFPLSTFLYVWILIHCAVLMIGGKWTYALNPLFEWLKEPFGWERNNYDKLGHFLQGFVPALVLREVLIRLNVVNGRKWLVVLVVSFCLAVSAFYEFIEWWVAVATGDGADAFLGTQGYVWDTQSDMFMAFCGALVAVVIFARTSDRAIEKVSAR
ncbi:MAG: DUF2238 domain-containing protein [Deltaproteobacteria bacterium]|nr:DUF2238 domain-containing protein [Deltaproteobacteria bacterium]